MIWETKIDETAHSRVCGSQSINPIQLSGDISIRSYLYLNKCNIRFDSPFKFRSYEKQEKNATSLQGITMPYLIPGGGGGGATLKIRKHVSHFNPWEIMISCVVV